MCMCVYVCLCNQTYIFGVAEFCVFVCVCVLLVPVLFYAKIKICVWRWEHVQRGICFTGVTITWDY